ncbi:2-keto-3-deoxygluconate kinase [Solibacillus sp. A46]|uniref:2-keto-3-deoxygluconate kinase n=1 Tax=Solibacillus faecavium TaxID=2762221 RepID=A0ABR8Y1P4_9BACL|nr:2-keto-3-deoxygluconate kinase [Solibacillus faecavium]MBD8038121.1 2-keto-3-deoxygluconate kinase [Solibacillus faecavium]
MKSEGSGRRRKDIECGTRRRGAQTFRRGRAIVFYRQLESKRATLINQLESKELQTIHPVIAGELKATEAIMNDFLELFQLNEILEDPQEN